jgi:hypothetical protein
MRVFSAFLLLALTAVWAVDGLAQGAATLWDHNGSQVYLSSSGPLRQFRYQAPVSDLLQLGVQPGTLLFDGRRNGNQYSGTAYVFSKLCGALPYAVAGPVSPDERTVTMYGKAPLVNTNCHVIGYRDDIDILVFNFSPPVDAGQNTTQPAQQRVPAQQPYDSEYDRFEEQWKVCFDIGRPDQSTSARILLCDAALSYSRLAAHDRARLLERRAALVQWGNLTAQKPIGGTISAPQANHDNTSTASNLRNPVTSREGYIDKTYVIPWNLIILACVGSIGILLIVTIANFVRPGQRDSQSSVAAIQNSDVKAPSTSSNLSPEPPNASSVSSEGLPQRYIPNEPPSQSMSLKLKRSQRFGVMGKVIFALDARIGLNAEEHSLVKRYRLGGFVVYDSKAREKYREATSEHLEMTRDHAPLSAGATAQVLGLWKSLYRLGRASVSAAMTALSLRITVDSLIQGVHVECKSMDELLAAENAIREAANNLKGYLETAVTFDGREEIIEL